MVGHQNQFRITLGHDDAGAASLFVLRIDTSPEIGGLCIIFHNGNHGRHHILHHIGHIRTDDPGITCGSQLHITGGGGSGDRGIALDIPYLPGIGIHAADLLYGVKAQPSEQSEAKSQAGTKQQLPGESAGMFLFPGLRGHVTAIPRSCLITLVNTGCMITGMAAGINFIFVHNNYLFSFQIKFTFCSFLLIDSV